MLKFSKWLWRRAQISTARSICANLLANAEKVPGTPEADILKSVAEGIRDTYIKEES